MLEFVDIVKRFGQATVLDGVAFDVRPGEVLALCGENGAGKSTLVSILAGVIAHGEFEGAIRLDGEPVELGGPADAEGRGIAMLPQELLFFADLSVAENVMAANRPARAGWVDRRRMHARARELCERVGLDVPLGAPMRRLERSEQQLACIARALALDPRVLVLDEPTAALPRPAAAHLFSVLRQLAADGRSVIYISHHLQELHGLADRVAVLRNGRLVLGPEPTPPVPRIVRAMLGEELGDAEPRRVAARKDGEAVFEVAVESVAAIGRTLLEGVSVSVRPGEIVGLAGLTGSGREELLRVGLGAQRGKVAAEVRVRGVAQRRWSPRRARRAGVFFLTEERREEGVLALAPALPNTLLGSEEFAARLGVRRPAREREATAVALEAVRVSDRDRTKLVGLLSGGNQQKVMFSRPLLQDSRVLLLGEPTRGIDIGARAAVHQLIRDLADEGRAVLISSSDHDELVAVCDRVVVLRRGAVTAELAGPALTEAAVTEAANADPRAEGVRDESPAANAAAG